MYLLLPKVPRRITWERARSALFHAFLNKIYLSTIFTRAIINLVLFELYLCRKI